MNQNKRERYTFEVELGRDYGTRRRRMMKRAVKEQTRRLIEYKVNQFRTELTMMVLEGAPIDEWAGVLLAHMMHPKGIKVIVL